MTLDLRAVEQQLKERSDFWTAEKWPADKVGTLAIQLLVALHAHRQECMRLHDAVVVLERKALQSPTDSITITGALLRAMRKPIAAMLATVTDAEEAP